MNGSARPTSASPNPILRGRLFSSIESYRNLAGCGVRLLAMLALAFAVYSPTLRAGFIWDDDDYVENNLNLRTPDGLRRIWFEPLSIPQFYPLVHTTFWLEHQIWLRQPWIYHLDNIMLHALTAFLAGMLLRRWGVPGAWFAAALFTVHPVHVESVAWVTERKNVLSGVFYLATAHAYTSFAGLDGTARSGGTRRTSAYLTAMFMFLAALLAKTITCTLPAAMLIVTWWKRGRIERRDLAAVVPMLMLGGFMGLMTAWVEKHHVGVGRMEDFQGWTPLTRLMIASRAPWFYLAKLAWPAPLAFFYEQWRLERGVAAAWGAPCLAAGGMLLVTLWRNRERIGRGPLVASLFFIVTLAPALGFVSVAPMRFSVVADHFQYLASLGPLALGAALAVTCLRRLGMNRTCQGVAAVVVVSALVATARSQTSIYHNRQTLYEAVLAKNPDSWIANVNLGMEFLALDRLEDAERMMRKAVRLRPENAQTLNNLGSILASQGRGAEAETEYRRALGFKPDFLNALVNLGMHLLAEKRIDEAREPLEKALRINPRAPSALYATGLLRLKENRVEDAIKLFEQALEADPSLMEPRIALEAIRNKP